MWHTGGIDCDPALLGKIESRNCAKSAARQPTRQAERRVEERLFLLGEDHHGGHLVNGTTTCSSTEAPPSFSALGYDVSFELCGGVASCNCDAAVCASLFSPSGAEEFLWNGP